MEGMSFAADKIESLSRDVPGSTVPIDCIWANNILVQLSIRYFPIIDEKK
jgi:hypothetical protein